MQFKKILVVCVGNICRSPMAKAFLQYHYPLLDVDSAGLADIPSQAADAKAQYCMQNFGLDLTQHRSKPINAPLIKWADIVLVMTNQQQRTLEQQFPFAKGKVFRLGHWQNQDIIDPYQKDQAIFDEVCQKIQSNIQTWDNYFKV